AQAQAQLQAGQNALNQQGVLAATQQGQQNQLAYNQLANQINEDQLNAQMSGQKLDADNYNQAQQLQATAANQNADRNQKSDHDMFSAITGAFGGLASGITGLSDARLKTDVRREDSAAAAFQRAEDDAARDRQAYADSRKLAYGQRGGKTAKTSDAEVAGLL